MTEHTHGHAGDHHHPPHGTARGAPAHHGHHDHHAHAPKDFGRAFLIGIVLNSAFVAIEGASGFFSHSMALLADAGHNLSDVLGLFAAWGASVLAKRGPSLRYSYGLRNASVMAAMTNAVLLMLAIGAIAWEAVLRLQAPQPVATGTMMVVAAVGIAVNGLTAMLFHDRDGHDLNVRGAYLHMVADAAVSLGVVVAAVLIRLTGLDWIDPITSLVIVAVIAIGTWGLLRDSLAMSLAAVPAHIDAASVQIFLGQQTGVSSVHDLHIWPLGTSEVALTAHLVMPGGHPGDHFLHETAEELHEHFGIGHVALQVETDGASCPLAPAHVV